MQINDRDAILSAYKVKGKHSWVSNYTYLVPYYALDYRGVFFFPSHFLRSVSKSAYAKGLSQSLWVVMFSSRRYNYAKMLLYYYHLQFK